MLWPEAGRRGQVSSMCPGKWQATPSGRPLACVQGGGPEGDARGLQDRRGRPARYLALLERFLRSLSMVFLKNVLM